MILCCKLPEWSTILSISCHWVFEERCMDSKFRHISTRPFQLSPSVCCVLMLSLVNSTYRVQQPIHSWISFLIFNPLFCEHAAIAKGNTKPRQKTSSARARFEGHHHDNMTSQWKKRKHFGVYLKVCVFCNHGFSSQKIPSTKVQSWWISDNDVCIVTHDWMREGKMVSCEKRGILNFSEVINQSHPGKRVKPKIALFIWTWFYFYNRRFLILSDARGTNTSNCDYGSCCDPVKSTKMFFFFYERQKKNATALSSLRENHNFNQWQHSVFPRK